MDLNRSCSSCKPFDHLEFKECDYDIKVHFISFVFWPNWKWFCKSNCLLHCNEQLRLKPKSTNFQTASISFVSLYPNFHRICSFCIPNETYLFMNSISSFKSACRLLWLFVPESHFFLFCFHVLFIQIILVDLNPISFSVSHMFAFKLLGFSSSAVGGALQPQWGRKSWPKMDKYTQTWAYLHMHSTLSIYKSAEQRTVLEFDGVCSAHNNALCIPFLCINPSRIMITIYSNFMPWLLLKNHCASSLNFRCYTFKNDSKGRIL